MSSFSELVTLDVDKRAFSNSPFSAQDIYSSTKVIKFVYLFSRLQEKKESEIYYEK